MTREVDVAIVGCGPVGAALAVALGRAGVRVTAIERETSIYHLPRAASFDGETLRMFQALGIGDEVAAVSGALRGLRMENDAGQTLLDWDVPYDRTASQGWGDAYLFHQPEVEALLRAEMARLPTVELRDGTEVVGLDQGDDAVHVTTRATTGDHEQAIDARYVVGCDGGSSFVRKAIGSRWENLGPAQEWIVVDGIERRPRSSSLDKLVAYCWPSRPHLFVPKPAPRLRWELMLRPDDDRDRVVTPEGAYGLIERFASPDDVEIERCAIYSFLSLLAEHWRDRRVLLAGDSAHLQPPLRGQGLCSGFRDVMNLSWKLGAVLRGEAEDALLDTYESERRPHAQAWIELATELSVVINTTDPEVAAKRDAHMLASPPPYVDETPPLGPGLHGDAAPPAGMLSDQVVLANGTRLDDRSRGRFTVAMTGAVGVQLSERARDVLTDDAWFDVLAVDSPEAAQLLARHGDPQALVIRPDRYILGAAESAAELERVLDGWLAYRRDAASR